jgi:integrase
LMADMPRQLPPYVNRQRTRHGKVLFYFRRGKGPRTPLPDPTAADFHGKYLAALNAYGPPERRIIGAGSLEWLIVRYKETTAYGDLSKATRRQRDNIFRGVVAKSGREPFKAITRKAMVAARDKRSATPAQARNFLDAMRGLFRWALEAEHVMVDPTAGVSNPKRSKGDGFPAWTEDDVAAYEARWTAGTKERVWLHVLLYTGLRRGDAVVLGRQHVRGSIATIKTEKTGTEVDIRISPELDATLKQGPTGDLHFIVGDGGRPLVKETFGNFFRAACNAAGITKSAHGLRKLAATKAAEAGCTVGELEARFGWTGGTMASLYTKTADRKRLAAAAEEKIGNAERPNLAGNRPTLKENQ